MCLRHLRLVRPFGESRIPSAIRFRPRPLVLLPDMRIFLPKKLQEAWDECRCAGSIAMLSFNQLNKRRDLRHRALCPKDDIIRFSLHVDAINRLMIWSREYHSSTKSLIAPPKLTRDDLRGLCLSKQAYDAWAHSYNRDVQCYLEGEYETYLTSKRALMEEIATVRESGNLTEAQFDTMRVLSIDFRAEMTKWEVHVERLPVPSYHVVLNEVFSAVIEGLEGSGISFNKFDAPDCVAPAQLFSGL
ncbi:hypothetical protein BDV18DRAFT_116098 [Aspergillus unguis]